MGDHVIIAVNGQIWHNVECDDAGQLLQEKNGATGAFRMEYKPSGDGGGGVMGFLNMLGQSVTETSRQQTARRRAELRDAPPPTPEPEPEPDPDTAEADPPADPLIPEPSP